ncbi:MAG: glycosyltransferase family 39 protein [Chloroflexi bacterium]|nr:glycosyltransferase family 39 protein [Chloroflexota bacterium]
MTISAQVPRRAPSDQASRSHYWRVIATLTVLFYVICAVSYSIAIPVLESSDENWHEAVVWHIAAGKGLPQLSQHDAGRLLVPAQEAGQPPLYYILAAATTFWLHEPNPATAMVVSPNTDIGHPTTTGWHKNLFVHPAPGERFPWKGVPLAVHLHRFLSIVFGALAIVLIFASARLMSNDSLAVVAAGLTAFNPMYDFITASVDNDSLAVLTGSLLLFLLLRVMIHPVRSNATIFLLGIALSLAILTKLSVASLGLPIIVIILLMNWRDKQIHRTIHHALLLFLPVLVIDGWWFVRNQIIYGDPLGLRAFIAIAGARPVPMTTSELVKELPGIWISFWGIFGAYDILLPHWQYIVYDIVAGVAFLGLVSMRWRRSTLLRRDGAVLLASVLLLEFVLLLRWTASTEASSGRLLFPVIASASILLATGLTRWLPVQSKVFPLALNLGLCCLSLLDLPLAIFPAYANPPLHPVASLHPQRLLKWHYGPLELLGITPPANPIHPGDSMTVTLYWVLTARTSQHFVVSVQLLTPSNAKIRTGNVQADSFPGGGKLLTSQWPIGQGLADPIPLQIPQSLQAPLPVRVLVAVYPAGQPSHPLSPVDGRGISIAVPVVAVLDVLPHPGTTATLPSGPTFGHIFVLQQALGVQALAPRTVSAGGSTSLHLTWYALQQPAMAYTLFVHVGVPGKPFVVQHDAPPLNGLFPTNEWLVRETVQDVIRLSIPQSTPPGNYPVRIGWYLPASGKRLSLLGASDELTIGSLSVLARGP